MADRPMFIRLSLPIGLEDSLEGLAREVLRSKPKDIYSFAADYFEDLLRKRNDGNEVFEYKVFLLHYLACSINVGWILNMGKVLTSGLTYLAKEMGSSCSDRFDPFNR